MTGFVSQSSAGGALSRDPWHSWQVSCIHDHGEDPGRRLIWDAIGSAVLACPSHHMPRQSLFTLYFPRSEIVSQTLTHFPPKGEQVHSGLLCLWLLFIPLSCGFYFYNIVNIKRGALQKRWPRVVPTLFYFQRITSSLPLAQHQQACLPMVTWPSRFCHCSLLVLLVSLYILSPRHITSNSLD